MFSFKALTAKKLLLLGGGVFLVSGAYFLGGFLGRGRNLTDGNFVRLEDGRKFRIEESAGMGPGGSGGKEQRANLTGKIKAIQDGRIVIDKYVMPSGGGQNGQRQIPAGDGSNSDNRQWSGQNGEGNQSRPTPTVSGEATILVDGSTVYVKSSQKGMRRSDQNSQPEIIALSDLKEGNIISIWSSTDQASGNELATKIMLRAN